MEEHSAVLCPKLSLSLFPYSATLGVVPKCYLGGWRVNEEWKRGEVREGSRRGESDRIWIYLTAQEPWAISNDITLLHTLQTRARSGWRASQEGRAGSDGEAERATVHHFCYGGTVSDTFTLQLVLINSPNQYRRTKLIKPPQPQPQIESTNCLLWKWIH